jgi:hypothetical protein
VSCYPSASLDALIVSVVPRLEATGASALVAIDPSSLELLAVRSFPASEYLKGVGTPRSVLIEHSRGLSRWGGRLCVAMFNGVRHYEVADARSLSLVPGEILSHPRAVDLHGVCVHGDELFAASTGADAVICWSLRDGTSRLLALCAAGERDLRFPACLALRDGYEDWRAVLPARLHVNDVCALNCNDMVVCSLREIREVQGDRVRVLYADQHALLHDGRPLGDDARLLFSDAATGELVIVDRDGAPPARIAIAPPNKWFLRGAGVIGGYAVALCSMLGETRQRATVRAGTSKPRGSGGYFAIAVIDLDTHQIAARRTIQTPELSTGVVAYAIVPWRKEITQPKAGVEIFRPGVSLSWRSMNTSNSYIP